MVERSLRMRQVQGSMPCTSNQNRGDGVDHARGETPNRLAAPQG